MSNDGLMIKAPISVGSVVIIRTNLGEDIIGTLMETSADVVVLKRPLGIQFIQEEGGAGRVRPGLGPISTSIAVDGPLSFNRANLIVFPARPIEGIEKMYISATSGITPAKSNDDIPKSSLLSR